MKLIESFETNRTIVKVYEMDFTVYYDDGKEEPIYLINSHDKHHNTDYIRYGNYIQMRSIIKTYEYARNKI